MSYNETISILRQLLAQIVDDQLQGGLDFVVIQILLNLCSSRVGGTFGHFSLISQQQQTQAQSGAETNVRAEVMRPKNDGRRFLLGTVRRLNEIGVG